MVTRAAGAEGDVPRVDVWLQRPGQPDEDCGQGWPAREVMALVTAVVNGQARRSAAGDTVLHAAVIGGPAGCVVLCGDTGVGKSTLCAAAAGRGWWHLSDDLAMVDVAARTVMPYLRPIMLRDGAASVLRRPPTLPSPPPGYERFVGPDRFLPASALGAQVAVGPQPLAALGFLRRGQRSATSPLSRAATLHALTVNAANLPDQGVAGFDELVRLAQAVEGLEVTVGDPDDVLDLLAPLVGQPVA